MHRRMEAHWVTPQGQECGDEISTRETTCQLRLLSTPLRWLFRRTGTACCIGHNAHPRRLASPCLIAQGGLSLERGQSRWRGQARARIGFAASFRDQSSRPTGEGLGTVGGSDYLRTKTAWWIPSPKGYFQRRRS